MPGGIRLVAASFGAGGFEPLTSAFLVRLRSLLADGASSSRGLASSVSAEGAVDDDLVQGALEEGELLIIELGDEQLRDPAGMDGRGFS